MTTIATGLSSVNRACLASCQGKIYYTNGYDPVKCWNGISATMQNAGIVGPTLEIGAPTAAAGGLSAGSHLIRYRYKDSTTGYVSNPSPALSYAVSGGNGLLTFGIGASDDIRTTTDPKVDQYVIEATRVGGGTFYQLGTASVGSTSVQVGMNDDSLAQQFNSDDAYGSSENLETYSSDIPPLGSILIPSRGRFWVMGDVAYPLTSVTFTNASTAVTGTGFSTRWAGRVILKDGDTTAYEIASVASTTAMTLAAAYGGTSTTTDAQVVSKFPNRGYYSGLFRPENYYPAVWARDFLADRSDQLVAAIERKDGLYVFGKNSAQRLIYNSDPSAAAGAVLLTLKGNRGSFNQRCVTDVEGEVYAWDIQGMWIVGETPQHISEPIQLSLDSYADYDQSDQFCVGFCPASRLVIFLFVAAGDTAPKMAAIFEIDTGRWDYYTWMQAITSMGLVATTDGQMRLMLGDENGYSWYFGINGAFDGTPPTCEPVVTVASATTTVITVNETLPTSSPNLAGVIIYDPNTGEARPCTSNTSTTITVSPAFSTAPAVDQEMFIGPINFEYRTKWWVGPGQETLKDPPYFVIKLFPGSASGKMRVYFYADMATTPSPVTANVSDEWPDGVSVVNGDNFITIDLDGGDGDGVVSVPVPISWKNAIQARVTSIRPDGGLRILDMQFALTKRGVATDVGT